MLDDDAGLEHRHPGVASTSHDALRMRRHEFVAAGDRSDAAAPPFAAFASVVMKSAASVIRTNPSGDEK